MAVALRCNSNLVFQCAFHVVWCPKYRRRVIGGRMEERLKEVIGNEIGAALLARVPDVLILREVLGYHADDVAEMLDSTVDSVNSALERARTALQRHLPPGEHEPPPVPDSPAAQELAEKFVRAYQSGDIDGLVALLTADVRVSMPPIPYEYHGRDVVGRFYASIIGQGRTYDFVPTRANGQLAFGAYLRGLDGIRHATGVIVLTLTGDGISAITRFDNSVLGCFGLPRTLP